MSNTSLNNAPLINYALKGLERCWLPDVGRWSHVYHLDGREPANESVPASDVFYTLNVLLGLSRVGQVPQGINLRETFQHNVVQLTTLPVPQYAFGMALWTGAELNCEIPANVLGHINSLLSDRNNWSKFRAQDLGMILAGVVAQAKHDPKTWTSLANSLFQFLDERYLCGTGLFFDAPRGMRRRFASFATQTYLTIACYLYGEWANNPHALEIANTATRKLISLQGTNGAWPWFFDVPTGRVVDFYEIYSVHQYGMAPAFLEFAERHGVTEARNALIKGFKWTLGENRFRRSMFIPDLHLSIRSLVRKRELRTKVLRIGRAIFNALLRRETRILSPGDVTLRLECRSYELGWILWSFGRRSDLPELSHHQIFVEPTETSPAKSPAPLLSVIIPHLNQEEELDICLSWLDSQTLKRSDFEVIVVDNGSTSLPQTVIARHPGTRLLSESNPGPGPARNCGVSASNGEYLCFIDADCRAHRDWLRVALRSIQTAPPRTILGGDVQIWHDEGTPLTSVEAYESVFAYMQKLYIEKRGFSGTGNLVVRREDFNQIGPFAGIEIAEDVQWGLRARAAGFQFIYVPEMVVYHPPRRSPEELFVKWDRHIQHALNVAREKPLWQIRWLARAGAVLISPLFSALKVVTTNNIHGVSSRLKAIGMLITIRVYRAWKMVDQLISSEGISWNREPGANRRGESS